MAERPSAAISIMGRQGPGADPFDVSLLSQSLPCKPRSLARPSPVVEEDPMPELELPKSSPAHEPILPILHGDTEKGRTLIRYNADITAEEFSSTPVQRETYLSQSCPNWSTFQMPAVEKTLTEPEPEETAPGAMAVPGHVAAVEATIEAEGVIGKSPTILETFKMYNAAGSVEDDISKLETVEEAELPPQEDDNDDEDQFALDA